MYIFGDSDAYVSVCDDDPSRQQKKKIFVYWWGCRDFQTILLTEIIN